MPLQDFWGRQHGEVFGNVDADGIQFEQFDLLAVLARAKDDSQRRVLASFGLKFGEPAQVQLHLACVLRLEIPLLELDHHQASQLAVVKQQIDIEIVAIELDAFLPRHEGDTGTEFKQKSFQFAQDGVLQVALQESVLQAQEIKNVGVFEYQRRSRLALVARAASAWRISSSGFLEIAVRS